MVKVTDIERVVGDCAVYERGRRLPGRVPLSQVSEVARSTDGFVWVGLQQPTASEVAAVAAEFGLPALAVEDSVNAHQRPKIEVYDGIVFVVLKPVRYVDHDEVVEVEEIELFLGESFVVTVRHGQSTILRQVRMELDSGQLANGRFDPTELHGPTAVLYRAADLMVDQYAQVMASIDEDLAEIEGMVFGAQEGDFAERIYKLKREVLDFRRAVAPLTEPVQLLADGDVPGVDPKSAQYFRDVHDHLLRATDGIESQDRLLSDVLQANVARVSVRQSAVAVRQNEDMRKISAWAAIALVPTAIAGIYGMNFDNMPELRWKYGYFLVLGLIATVCLTLYRLFKRNGWL